MKYDAKDNVIRIELGEFVSIAHRGISSTSYCDGDEPTITKVRGRLATLGGVSLSREIEHSFTSGEHSFILSGTLDTGDTGDIILTRLSDSPTDKLRRDEMAIMRAEGFILGYMRSLAEGCDGADLKYVCHFSRSGKWQVTEERVPYSKLQKFFNNCLIKVALFASPEIDRVTRRLPSMQKLKFPYGNIREGQKEFVRVAYRILSRGGSLFASAPTGTGKTVAALYPAIRALGDGRVDKVFYLTPKTTTAEAARECLNLMTEGGAVIRAIILTAKEKCCTVGNLCKTSRKLCENSQNKRISEAALELMSLGKCVVDINDVRCVAKKYTVCAYELSLTYAELCDVVICDFNYLFDPSVYIKRFFQERGHYALLVDEAHNLPERAREMFSAELSTSDIERVELNTTLGEFSATRKLAPAVAKRCFDILYPTVKEDIRERQGGDMAGAVSLSEPPSELYTAFDELLCYIEEELQQNYAASDEERDARITLLRDYRIKIKKFSDTLAAFDSAYKLLVFYENGEIRAKLFCLDTGRVIKERLAKGHSALLFSATLSPLSYYRAVLGGDRSDEMLEVNSPFDPSQLSVTIMDKISTRFSEREDTLSAVCRVIAATISAKRGNYMIFSPSFAYSEALASAFRAKYPKLRIISQKRDMTREQKAEFLDEFKKDHSSYLVAFCVMGGIYSEGIDLAGDSLIGTVIVGIGMPALSYEREAIATYYEEKYEEGKQYAYIYPGMNRVFQAAGRVIRREDDRGVIVLIDDRFDDPIYKKSLPKLWEGVKFIGDAKELRAELDEFWQAKNQ